MICFINHTHFPSRCTDMITTYFTGPILKGWAFIFFHLSVQSDYCEKHFHPEKFKFFVSECTGCNSQQHLLPTCSFNSKFPFLTQEGEISDLFLNMLPRMKDLVLDFWTWREQNQLQHELKGEEDEKKHMQVYRYAFGVTWYSAKTSTY